MNFECLDTLLHYYQKWDKESFNECRKISIKLGTRKVSLVMNKSTEFQEIIDTHFSGFFQKNYLFVNAETRNNYSYAKLKFKSLSKQYPISNLEIISFLSKIIELKLPGIIELKNTHIKDLKITEDEIKKFYCRDTTINGYDVDLNKILTDETPEQGWKLESFIPNKTFITHGMIEFPASYTDFLAYKACDSSGYASLTDYIKMIS